MKINWFKLFISNVVSRLKGDAKIFKKMASNSKECWTCREYEL